MKICPFCKTSPPSNSDEEEIERLKKRVEKGIMQMYFISLGDIMLVELGVCHKIRERLMNYGLRQGSLDYFNLGIAYANANGRRVEIDTKKAKHYYELAAMNGSVNARHNLGAFEGNAGSR